MNILRIKHHLIEKKGPLFTFLVTITVSVGGIVEIIPPFFVNQTAEPVAGTEPYSALELAGRDIYIREGCSGCHSQMIRPFKWESARFTKPDIGERAYSESGEYIYDRPFLWGSKRTGPDLWRESMLRDAAWHYRHFRDPQMGGKLDSTVMPAYPWLYDTDIDPADIIHRMKTLNFFGTYDGKHSDLLLKAAKQLTGKKEIDALVAYMMKLGRKPAQ